MGKSPDVTTNILPEQQSSQRILVVDDDPSVVSVLREYLIQHNYDVIEAGTGKDALLSVDKYHPDLILLDIGIPEINGLDVCRTLKQDENTQTIPIMIITVHSSRTEKIEGLSAGADDFISKPIDLDEMLPRIKAHIKMKTLHDSCLQQYKETEKLKDRNSFLTRIMIHDLKNPLTGIYGYLQIIKHGLESAKSTKQLDFVSRAMAGCEELNAVMSNLLDLIKLMDNKLQIDTERFKLSELIEKCINKEYVPDNVFLNITNLLANDGISVSSDEQLLARIIRGLTHYAIRTSNHKLPINIKIGMSDSCAKIIISADGLNIPETYKNILQNWNTSELSKQDASVDPGFTLAFCTLASKAINCNFTIENIQGNRQFELSIPVESQV